MFVNRILVLLSFIVLIDVLQLEHDSGYAVDIIYFCSNCISWRRLKMLFVTLNRGKGYFAERGMRKVVTG